MLSERVENLRGLSGGAQRDFNGSKSLWYDTLPYSPICKSFKKWDRYGKNLRKNMVKRTSRRKTTWGKDDCTLFDSRKCGYF